MKSKTRKDKERTRQVQAPNTSTMPARRRLLGLPKLMVITLITVFVAGASFAVFSVLLPGKIPFELVGQWRVMGGQMDGTIFEFQRNGAMIGRKSLPLSGVLGRPLCHA